MSDKSKHNAARIGLILCALLAGCAVPSAKPASPTVVAPTHTPAPTQRAATIALKETACRAGAGLATCYDLTAPERHEAPDGRTIQLHVAVYRSTKKDRVDDPILFLMGGPGAPGIDSYSWNRNFSPFNSRRDVIVLDQRGTGSSIPKLTCPEFVSAVYETQKKDMPDEESTKIIVAAMRACRERLTSKGVDLSAYNNAEIAADVEDLRHTLGIEKWNLFGWSYGARVALTVMRDYPNSVRSAVLDSVYPPQGNQLSEFAASTQAAFGALFARCKANAKCDQAYPDLERVFYQLLVDLDARPIETAYRRIDSLQFINVLLSLMFSSDGISTLPGLIYEVHDGNTASIKMKAAPAYDSGSSFADGMAYSVDCADEVRFNTPAVVEAAGKGVSAQWVEMFAGDLPEAVAICDAWGVGPSAPVENAPVVSAAPTLLLAGDIDPYTPPAWARRTASTLSKAQVAEFPGLGHGIFRADSMTKGCVSQLVEHFLDHPDDSLDMSCLETFARQPRAFVLP